MLCAKKEKNLFIHLFWFLALINCGAFGRNLPYNSGFFWKKLSLFDNQCSTQIRQQKQSLSFKYLMKTNESVFVLLWWCLQDCRLKEWKLLESEAMVKSNLSESCVYGRMAIELNKVVNYVINERTWKVAVFGFGKIFNFFVKSLWILVVMMKKGWA